MKPKFTTIMVSNKLKSELDFIFEKIKKEYPFIDSYNDLINYLVWFWNKNNKLGKYE